jgi:hypothetical protein
MVAQLTNTPPDLPRPLSPAVQAQLSQAIAALTASGSTAQVSEMLKCALQSAAREARERNLRPEELVLAFKELERTLDTNVPEYEKDGKVAMRSVVIRALLEAYYER